MSSGTYTTIAGDMWDGIAHSEMGSRTYTQKLRFANPEYYNYYIFPTGITLTLPDEETYVSENLPPWRQTS